MDASTEKGAEVTELPAPFTGTFEGQLLILMLGPYRFDKIPKK
jgi:hypothetical protein